MSSAPRIILLVEDNPGDACLLQEVLRESRRGTYSLVQVDRLEAALRRLREVSVDIILVDLGLPDSQGLETFHRIQAQAAHMPITVLAGIDDDTLGATAVQAGAQDYLTKGQVEVRFLERSIRYAIERHRLLWTQQEQWAQEKRRLEQLARTSPTLVLELMDYLVSYYRTHTLGGETLPESESPGIET